MNYFMNYHRFYSRFFEDNLCINCERVQPSTKIQKEHELTAFMALINSSLSGGMQQEIATCFCNRKKKLRIRFSLANTYY